MTHQSTTVIKEVVPDEDKPSPIEDRVITRFSNRNRQPRPSAKVTNTSSAKQHCVGDYSCCGRVP